MVLLLFCFFFVFFFPLFSSPFFFPIFFYFLLFNSNLTSVILIKIIRVKWFSSYFYSNKKIHPYGRDSHFFVRVNIYKINVNQLDKRDNDKDRRYPLFYTTFSLGANRLPEVKIMVSDCHWSPRRLYYKNFKDFISLIQRRNSRWSQNCQLYDSSQRSIERFLYDTGKSFNNSMLIKVTFVFSFFVNVSFIYFYSQATIFIFK